MRVGKVNLHAHGMLPTFQMKEHFELLPSLEGAELSGLLNAGTLYWAGFNFPESSSLADFQVLSGS